MGQQLLDDTYFLNGQPQPCSGYCTDVFFAAASEFISEPTDAPFFVYLATNAMHAPFLVEDRYTAPYRELGIPDARASFYGMIANFDENIGRLFQRLEELDLAENTIVVFTSDHGRPAGFDAATEMATTRACAASKGRLRGATRQLLTALAGRIAGRAQANSADRAYRRLADIARPLQYKRRKCGRL